MGTRETGKKTTESNTSGCFVKVVSKQRTTDFAEERKIKT